MNRFLRLLAIAAGLALVAGACGDDGGDGGAASVDDPLVQAIVDDMLADGSMGADQAQAECFASRVVGGVGNDRLTELGVTPDNVGELDEIAWTQDEAELIVDELFECTDVEDGFAGSMVSDELDEEQSECIADAFGTDRLKDFFVTNLMGEEPTGFLTDVASAMEECGIDPLAG